MGKKSPIFEDNMQTIDKRTEEKILVIAANQAARKGFVNIKAVQEELGWAPCGKFHHKIAELVDNVGWRRIKAPRQKKRGQNTRTFKNSRNYRLIKEELLLLAKDHDLENYKHKAVTRAGLVLNGYNYKIARMVYQELGLDKAPKTNNEVKVSLNNIKSNYESILKMSKERNTLQIGIDSMKEKLKTLINQQEQLDKNICKLYSDIEQHEANICKLVAKS